MIPTKASLVSRLCAAVFCTCVGISTCHAQQPTKDGLKTVDNPGGGQFVYGPLTGQSSKAAALVYMLHLVHNHFGDKPQIGRLLQSRDGSSLATFFTLNAKTLGGKPISGLVIISMPNKGTPQAAVLYDDARSFVSTEPSMMQKLTAAWQGSLGGSPGSVSPNGHAGQQAPQPSGSAQQLFPATAGDRSAMIKMPRSWRLTGVGGGSLIAEGDRGEMVMLGIIYQNIINPQSPQSQRLLSGPMASRGPRTVCPLTENLFSDYVCVFNQTRHNNGKPQGNFNFTGLIPQQGGSQIAGHPIVAKFTVDFNDGMGLRNGSARLSLMGPLNPRAATWAMMASMSNIPQRYGSAMDPTLVAVVESYSQDAAVIGREGAADLNRIHQQGLANQAQADAINQRRVSSANAYEAHRQQLNQNSVANDQHNAEIDWQSKINQDYILDRSVIRDAGDTVHVTTSNNLADALVKSNPNKLEYVPNQQLIRGVDY
jgi:hypothetical protein